jgi:hypothetical protein
MRTVYVNGAYVPENEATISVFDRGFLFGDGIYEVASVLGGKLIDFPPISPGCTDRRMNSACVLMSAMMTFSPFTGN